MKCNACSKFLLCDKKECNMKRIRYIKMRRIPKMIYDIEEQIQDIFNNKRIEVNYIKDKIYSVKVDTMTYLYNWNDNATMDANIYLISRGIKALTK